MEFFITDFKKCLTPIIIFLILFVVDFIFGILKGCFIEQISSAKLRLSVPKFIAYLGMILICFLLDTLIISSTEIEFAPIALICVIFFCLIELTSIIENAKVLGIEIPNVLVKTIENLKNNFFNSEESEEDFE